MQIMPQTQKTLGVTNPWDPVQSIFGAAKYLSQGLDAEGSPEGALLYYHGGPGWRQTYATNKESQTYVPGVAGYYKALTGSQAAAGDGSASSQPPAPPPPGAPPGASQQPAPLIIGDSLASPQGLGGSGVVGASPQVVKDNISALSDAQVNGRDVILSSGASNNPAQAALAADQIKALYDKGAHSVTVVGVGEQSNFAGVNTVLQQAAAKGGARFVPLPAGTQVHPSRTGYNALLAAALPKAATY